MQIMASDGKTRPELTRTRLVTEKVVQDGHRDVRPVRRQQQSTFKRTRKRFVHSVRHGNEEGRGRCISTMTRGTSFKPTGADVFKKRREKADASSRPGMACLLPNQPGEGLAFDHMAEWTNPYQHC